MSIGDVNSDAKGSGARYNSGKPDFSLIPISTLADEARVWEYGTKKYAPHNWMKGMKWSVPFGCLMRHMAAWQAGEENDPESGLPHLAHAMCNLRMLTLYATTFQEGDDRPTKWMKDYVRPSTPSETPVENPKPIDPGLELGNLMIESSEIEPATKEAYLPAEGPVLEDPIEIEEYKVKRLKEFDDLRKEGKIAYPVMELVQSIRKR